VIALAGSVFVAGLLGSAHCAGMCGSFACLASDGAPTGAGGKPTGGVVGTLAYSMGRLFSYLSLGVIVGAAGSGLDRAGAVAGVARPASMTAGALLIIWGVARLLAMSGVHVPALAVPPALASALAGAVRRVRERPPALRGLALGALSAALPCGWLYAFVATAAAAGSAAGGALVMGAFWVGTLPVMVALGLGAQRVLGPVRRRLPLLSAATLIVLGVLTVAGRVGTGLRSAADPSPATDVHAHR
jgi:sulfite exporter TauE/SafE